MDRLFAEAAAMLETLGWKPPRYGPQAPGLYMHVAVYHAAQRQLPADAAEDQAEMLYNEAIGMLRGMPVFPSLLSWVSEKGRTQVEVIALLRQAQEKYA